MAVAQLSLTVGLLHYTRIPGSNGFRKPNAMWRSTKDLQVGAGRRPWHACPIDCVKFRLPPW